MRKYPVGMVLGGFYSWDTGTLGTQGTNCYYWSGSAYTSSTDSYRLDMYSSNSTVHPAGYSTKRAGFPLRCLAQKVNNNIENSIFPTGNTTGEFQSLYNQYPTYDQMRKYPVGMVLGGYYNWGNGTSPRYQGTNGGYWSSSAYTSATHAYYLILFGTNSAVYPADYNYKINGFSLRCLAQ